MRAAADSGCGARASHLLGGHRRQHERLEEELAEWIGRPRALLFSTGYMAALGVGSALLGRHDLCVQDRLNHACLLDAARLPGAHLKRYRHLDVEDARRCLRAEPERAALLISDSLFSMDGDCAPLPALAQLAREEGAWLMVDEAHALGVLGPDGAGACAEAGLGCVEVPVWMGTFGKALGAFGAAIAGSEALIEALVNGARSYVYTTALPPALAAALRVAVALARSADGERAHLATLVACLRQGLADSPWPLLPSKTPIQPLLLGDSRLASRLAIRLEDAGFHVPAVRPPTVPPASARLRITLSAAHRLEDVERLAGSLRRAAAAES